MQRSKLLLLGSLVCLPIYLVFETYLDLIFKEGSSQLLPALFTGNSAEVAGYTPDHPAIRGRAK